MMNIKLRRHIFHRRVRSTKLFNNNCLKYYDANRDKYTRYMPHQGRIRSKTSSKIYFVCPIGGITCAKFKPKSDIKQHLIFKHMISKKLQNEMVELSPKKYQASSAKLKKIARKKPQQQKRRSKNIIKRNPQKELHYRYKYGIPHTKFVKTCSNSKWDHDLLGEPYITALIIRNDKCGVFAASKSINPNVILLFFSMAEVDSDSHYLSF